MQPSPIIVHVVDQPFQSTTIADVLIGAIGLTGAMLLAAAALGAVLGAVLIGVKLLRARFGREPTPDSEALRVTPGWGQTQV